MLNFFAESLPQDSARSHLPSESLSGDSAENKCELTMKFQLTTTHVIACLCELSLCITFYVGMCYGRQAKAAWVARR